MSRASPGSVNANDAVSGAGQTAPLAQARARARAGGALPICPPDGRPRSPGGVARARVNGQGIALAAELAAQWPSLPLYAEAVAP